jgi:ribosomal protein L37E
VSEHIETPTLHYFSERGSECVKCGHPYSKVRHHAAKAPGTGSDGCRWPDEHLHLTCERCGYQWPCHPKDSQPALARSVRESLSNKPLDERKSSA